MVLSLAPILQLQPNQLLIYIVSSKRIGVNVHIFKCDTLTFLFLTVIFFEIQLTTLTMGKAI